MRNAKKALLLALCALLLVGASIMGTLAYLTSQATVTNTFTVGNVAITMDESPVDEYGNVVSGDRRTTNNYKLIPGHKYTKDPIIHVGATSEDCYIFVEITENDKFTLNDMTNWTRIDQTNVWYYNAVAHKSENIPVFKSITYAANAVDGEATPAEEALIIKAYAVQKDGFDDAVSAWNATFGK